MRDQSCVRATVAIFFRAEVSPALWLHSERVNQRTRNSCSRHPQRFAGGADVLPTGSPCAYRLPGLGFLLDVEKFRRRKPELLQLHRGELAVDSDQSLRFAIGKRSQ